MPPKTNAEKQREYYKRQKDAGFVKACVYVPSDKVAELQAFAAKLRLPHLPK